MIRDLYILMFSGAAKRYNDKEFELGVWCRSDVYDGFDMTVEFVNGSMDYVVERGYSGGVIDFEVHYKEFQPYKEIDYLSDGKVKLYRWDKDREDWDTGGSYDTMG